MQIWITGCSGFLGKRLAVIFKQSGHNVLGLSRRISSTVDVPVTIDLAADAASEKLQDTLDNYGCPDVLVHTASQQPGQHSYSEYVKNNVLCTSSLLDSFGQRIPKLIIYTSTHSVYGMPETNPVAESHPIRGNTLYALTKRCSEQILEDFQNRAQVVIFRLPSMYGMGQVGGFIDGLAEMAVNNETIELFSKGESVRDVLYVNDVVEAILACAKCPPASSFSIMNLGCGRKIITQEYAETLIGALGSNSKIVPIDRPSQFNFYADVEEAKRQIGFSPTPLLESMNIYANELKKAC